MLCDGYFGIVYTFNLLFIHCCIYRRGEVSVNLVAVHAHARAPMASHAMAPCASAARSRECMYVPIKQHHKNIEISKRWNHRKMVRLLQRNKRC